MEEKLKGEDDRRAALEAKQQEMMAERQKYQDQIDKGKGGFNEAEEQMKQAQAQRDALERNCEVENNSKNVFFYFPNAFTFRMLSCN